MPSIASISLLFLGLLLPLHLAQAGQKLTLGGSGADLGIMRDLGEAFSALHPGVKVEVLPNMGSSGGIKATLSGRLGIGLAARPLRALERRQGARQIVYAKTPLVFAVSTDREIDGVTYREITGYYSGELTRWPDGVLVRPILRPLSDSDNEILRGYSPAMSAALDKARRRRGIPVALTDQDAAGLIGTVPGAVGTSTLALILGEQRSLKALAIDNVKPSVEAIADGSYPLFKTLYFVLGPRPSDLARAFITFVATPRGTALLRETGHLVVTSAGEEGP